MQSQLSNQILSSQQIDSLVTEKLRKFQNSQSLEDEKKKALNLKIKAAKSSNFGQGLHNLWESGNEEKNDNVMVKELKEEMDAMKMEMVKEIRDMKNTMTTSMSQIQTSMNQMSLGTLQSVKELKKLNKNMKGEKGEDSEESLNEEILKCPYSGQIIGKKLKEKIDKDIKNESKTKPPIIDLKDDAPISPRIEEVKKSDASPEKAAEPSPVKVAEPAPVMPELTEEQKTLLSECVTKFQDKFAEVTDKESSMKQLKFVFNMIKNPNSNENFRVISLSNEKFKRIKDSNEYF